MTKCYTEVDRVYSIFYCIDCQVYSFQIQQAQSNQFNMHIHVEYEWRLRQDDWYESDDDLEDKVSVCAIRKSMLLNVGLACCERIIICMPCYYYLQALIDRKIIVCYDCKEMLQFFL